MNFIGEDILFGSVVYIVSLLFSDLFLSILTTPPILYCVMYMTVSLLPDFLSFHSSLVTFLRLCIFLMKV